VSLLTLALGSCAAPQHGPSATAPAAEAIATTLDSLHRAAALADGPAYFSLFATDAVFLGTDATERWTLDEFEAYAMPYFRQGKGWTYVPRERHIAIAPDGTIAWFDELLDNAKYGECRGTGVLRREGLGRWLVVQYSLTKLIPNDAMEAAVKAIESR
jgi:SnoaL-like domain